MNIYLNSPLAADPLLKEGHTVIDQMNKQFDSTNSKIEKIRLENSDLASSQLFGSFTVLSKSNSSINENQPKSELPTTGLNESSFILLSSSYSDSEVAVPNSITSQLENIHEVLKEINNKIGQATIDVATLTSGGYTLLNAIAAACVATTPFGTTVAGIQFVAGFLTIAGVTKNVYTAPLEAKTMLGNADALISMVKMAEQVNLAEIAGIDKNLEKLEIVHKEIHGYADKIKTEMEKGSEALQLFFTEAREKFQEGSEKINIARTKFELSKEQTTLAIECLNEATMRMNILKKVLISPIKSVEQAKDLLAYLCSLAEQAVALNNEAQKLLDKARAESDDGQKMLFAVNSCVSAVDTYFKTAGVMQQEIKKVIVQEADRIVASAKKAKVQAKEIKNTVKKIETNLKDNIDKLNGAQNEIEKAKQVWNRHMSYAAAFLGMAAAVATSATMLGAFGFSFYPLAIGTTLALIAGSFTATTVNDAPPLLVILSNKISQLCFGKIDELKKEDLPAPNKVVIKFDSLSSSLLGKLKKRQSKTVGCVHVNIAGKQLKYRFDLRENYPIAPLHLKELIDEIKTAIEKDPKSVDLQQIAEGFIFKKDLLEELTGVNLLGEASKGTFLTNLMELQKFSAIPA